MALAHENITVKYWLIVWSKDSGDFRNAIMEASSNETLEDIESKFETQYSKYRVIHIGEGELPPKTYRSLEYLN